VIALAALAAGCAQVPQLSREQQLAATTRTYSGVTKEQLIDAARRVLILADEDDVRFADNPDGFSATRRWSVYLVLAATVGTDNWVFSVRETPQGPQGFVGIGRLEQAVTVTPTTAPGVYSAGTTAVVGNPIPGNAVYDLFWSRVDYMLWRTDTWATCDSIDAKIQAGKVVGGTDPLCNRFNVTDYAPNQQLDLKPPTGFSAAQNIAVKAPTGTGKRAIDRAPKP
jgi:hypothetical protein